MVEIVKCCLLICDSLSVIKDFFGGVKKQAYYLLSCFICQLIIDQTRILQKKSLTPTISP